MARIDGLNILVKSILKFPSIALTVPHTVIVLEDGFEWRGKRRRSLSVIAKLITGAHWSGPRFFGLNGKAEAQVAIGEAADA